jgi:hypothetical protein
MKTSSSVLQWGHFTRLDRDGCTTTSPSQALHLKCIIGVMRALIVILLVAASVHAQSLADVARKERERRASLKPATVIKAEGTPAPAAPAAGPAGPAAPAAPAGEAPKAEEAKKPEEAKPNTGAPAAAPAGPATPADAKAAEKPGDKTAEQPKEPPKPQPPPVDPTKEWNAQLDKVRAKIQSLQDEEAATQLRINQLNNQIYAPVVDQAAKDQALAQIGDAQQKLSAVRLELDQTRRALETLQLQGPPKK